MHCQPASHRTEIRETNDRIAELTRQYGGEHVRLYCECGDPSCEEAARLTLAAWEQVRREPNVFLLAPDHVEPPAGKVLARGRGYWLGLGPRH
jgi:hypothetical protein